MTGRALLWEQHFLLRFPQHTQREVGKTYKKYLHDASFTSVGTWVDQAAAATAQLPAVLHPHAYLLHTTPTYLGLKVVL